MILELIVAGGISGYGYLKTRKFVRERLRFIDAVQKPGAAVAAGAVTGLATAAVAPMLPIIGAITAVAVGVGIGAGVSAGAKDSKRLPGL